LQFGDRQTNRQTNRWTGPLHEAALAIASGCFIIVIFDYVSRFISEMIQDETIATIDANRNSYAIYQMVLFSMVLNNPKQDFKVTPLFHSVYLRNGTRCSHSYNEMLIGTIVTPYS